MINYLFAIGWWNLTGSILMLAFLNESLGNNILIEWTGIFKTKFDLGYYGKLLLLWAVGLNTFFALINILASYWKHAEMMTFLLWTDILVYILFIISGIWGLIAKRCGSGIYVTFLISLIWISWGVFVLFS